MEEKERFGPLAPLVLGRIRDIQQAQLASSTTDKVADLRNQWQDILAFEAERLGLKAQQGQSDEEFRDSLSIDDEGYIYAEHVRF